MFLNCALFHNVFGVFSLFSVFFPKVFRIPSRKKIPSKFVSCQKLICKKLIFIGLAMKSCIYWGFRIGKPPKWRKIRDKNLPNGENIADKNLPNGENMIKTNIIFKKLVFIFVLYVFLRRKSQKYCGKNTVKMDDTQALTSKFKLNKEDIMLIQPNNVVFSQYSISEIQENILTLITEKLQGYMSKGEDLQRDLFGQPCIEILCDEAGGDKHKSRVLKEVNDLTYKHFKFSWIHPTIHKTINSTGVIITTYHDIKGTNRVALTLNVWAIPFLLYYGVGFVKGDRGGGSIFTKGTILSLRGNYTKRIYKLICSQWNRNEYFMKIDDFRKDMEIDENKDNYYIDKKILKVAEERIKAANPDVWFDYELITRNKVPGRKSKSDTIVFHIHTKRPITLNPEQEDIYHYIEATFFSILEGYNSNLYEVAAQKIVSSGELESMYFKLKYYETEVRQGKMPREKMANTIIKILREDFQIYFKPSNKDI